MNNEIRVLWTVFVTFPEVSELIGQKSEYACTWARALANQIRHRDDIKLAIASVSNRKNVSKFEVDNIIFYFLPNKKNISRTGGGDKAQKAWKEILNDFNPDIIHIHGSESLVPYELIKLKPNVPLFLTLQGILSNYYKDYTAGIDEADIRRTKTFRDYIRHSGIYGDKIKAKKKSFLEKEMIRGVRYIGGRTTWDKVTSKSINPNAEYLYSPEMIRNEFYASERWDIKKIDRHRIFMHQGFKPIKGLHFMLEALAVLKEKYPDVQLYMSGTNVMRNSSLKDKLREPGYVKYLFEKIQILKLEDCIHFTGILNEKQIVDELKKSHVMVLPSTIENSPNSLCEAQLVGIPCVASFVGGVPEMLRDGLDGLLYTYNEPLLLAEYIGRIFESDELAEQFSLSSYEWIRNRQGQDYVREKTIENYHYIVERGKK